MSSLDNAVIHHDPVILCCFHLVRVCVCVCAVGGGGGGYCEVVIRRSVAGEFALNLICDIEHSTHPVTLSLHGWTQVNVHTCTLYTVPLHST